jgi:hypothetical protein
LRDIHDGQCADLQPTFRAAGATVVKLVQAISLLAALGNEGGILCRDQFVRLWQGRLNRFRVVFKPRKTALKLAGVCALRVVAIARQVSVVDTPAQGQNRRHQSRQKFTLWLGEF